jgi:putative ABC transport system permease protein
MAQLNNEHIDYIIKDLHYRGIVLDGFQDEMADHICSAVEAEMEKEKRFIDAYHFVLKKFGHTNGLRKTQLEIIRSEIKPARLMFRNYITIALRNLKKHRFYTLINVTGLAIGIAACLIIALYVTNELSYDQYHAKASRIFRINNEIKFGGNHFRVATESPGVADIFSQSYPEIESVVRLRTWGARFVKRSEGTEVFKEPNVFWADSTFFKIFSIPVIEGDPETALRDPNTIAISRKMAEKYFPGENAVGQSLILPENQNCKVTAVFENVPPNSHFHLDILISMASHDEAKSVSLVSGGGFATYVLLKEGTDPKKMEEKIPALVEKHIAPQIADVVGGDFTMEKYRASGDKWEYTLMPLTDIHLRSDLLDELEPNSDITYIYLFSAIALFILAIACTNFMNLSTARSSNRAKEVGIRKVMGSLRLHLIRQFLTESFLLSLFSFMLAVVLAYLLLPVFNDLAQKKLSLPLSNFNFYAGLLTASVLVGILAGLYPSFFLSAFKPVNVLKGHLSLGMKSGMIRSVMVVFQFMVSIFLIIGTITVNRQLTYIQNKKMGFKKDQVIVVKDAHLLGSNIRAFKEEMSRNNFITSGTISGFLPVDGSWRSSDTFFEEGVQLNQESLKHMVNLQTWSVDLDYIKTLGMKIKTGRDFSPDFLSDSSAVIMNEAAAKRFGFNDPIGKKISSFDGNKQDGSPDPEQIKTWNIIGVVEDFHFESLKSGIRPLAFFLNSHSNGNVSFRFEAANTQEVIQKVEGLWKKMADGQPFQYSFLDEDFESMYSSEQRLGKIFAVFAGLAIFIACLGLFALTAFTAEQRTKEIGIRKVLGASVGNIVLLLSREFGKLIFLAFFLSLPLAWFAVNWWLKNYTYKTEVGIFIYLLAGGSAFLLAWLTMSYQSIKAANANPVNSLRNE